jgi:DNA repair exonuclease SbcCD nuclease subunit
VGPGASVRILIFSDLHLHNHVYGATTMDYDAFDLKGVNSRLIDGAKVLRDIYFYINDNPVDVVVFCGDLFHTHGKIDAAVLKVAHEGMWRIKQHLEEGQMYALVGNHDTADKSMNIHAMHWLESVGVNVVDGAWHNNFNGLYCKLSFLAYTESVEEIEKFFADAADKADGAIYKGHEGGTVCFMHAGIDGVPMKSGFVPGSAFNTDMIPEGIQHVFSGHYHPHMKVTEKATVVGSPLQLNWADEGDQRGFIVYDTETGEQEFHEIDAPKFVTLDMDNGYKQLTIAPMVQGHFIRVVNHDHSKQEDIREELTGAGARSVEFVVKEKEVDRLQPLSSDELHIPDIIKDYEEQQAVTPERSKVGEELRK